MSMMPGATLQADVVAERGDAGRPASADEANAAVATASANVHAAPSPQPLRIAPPAPLTERLRQVVPVQHATSELGSPTPSPYLPLSPAPAQATGNAHGSPTILTPLRTPPAGGAGRADHAVGIMRTTTSAQLVPQTTTEAGPGGSIMIPWDTILFYFDAERRPERLGHGNFSFVYAGHWNFAEVAVKIIKFNGEQPTTKQIADFRAEVRITSKLRNQNIVPLLACSEVVAADGSTTLAILMPNMNVLRTQLRAAEDRGRPIPLQQQVAWMLQVARGLAYCHGLSPPVLHNDLKSANVLLDEHGDAKICDFGLAITKNKYMCMSQGSGGRTAETAGIGDRRGAGTLQWMAPEVCREEPATIKSDVYSFGVFMWEILTCKIPFADSRVNPIQILLGVGEGKLCPNISCIPPEVPSKLKDLIASCWKTEPVHRPSMPQVVDTLVDVAANLAAELGGFESVRLEPFRSTGFSGRAFSAPALPPTHAGSLHPVPDKCPPTPGTAGSPVGFSRGGHALDLAQAPAPGVQVAAEHAPAAAAALAMPAAGAGADQRTAAIPAPNHAAAGSSIAAMPPTAATVNTVSAMAPVAGTMLHRAAGQPVLSGEHIVPPLGVAPSVALATMSDEERRLRAEAIRQGRAARAAGGSAAAAPGATQLQPLPHAQPSPLPQGHAPTEHQRASLQEPVPAPAPEPRCDGCAQVPARGKTYRCTAPGCAYMLCVRCKAALNKRGRNGAAGTPVNHDPTHQVVDATADSVPGPAGATDAPATAAGTSTRTPAGGATLHHDDRLSAAYAAAGVSNHFTHNGAGAADGGTAVAFYGAERSAGVYVDFHGRGATPGTPLLATPGVHNGDSMATMLPRTAGDVGAGGGGVGSGGHLATGGAAHTAHDLSVIGGSRTTEASTWPATGSEQAAVYADLRCRACSCVIAGRHFACGRRSCRYDLCERCIRSRQASDHDPSHEMLELPVPAPTFLRTVLGNIIGSKDAPDATDFVATVEALERFGEIGACVAPLQICS